MRDEASKRLAEAREVERRLHCSVASLERQVEQYPSSKWAGSQLIQAQQELRAVEERRHEFLFHRQAAHWTQVGDRVSREFFWITCPRHSGEGSRSLQRSDGSIATDPEELRTNATHFYSSLLTCDEISGTSGESRQRVLRHVQRSVTDDMRRRLLAPFSESELLDAVRALPRDRCPGEDGLSPTFFLTHWDLLKEGLLLAFQEIMDVGSMRESL